MSQGKIVITENDYVFNRFFNKDEEYNYASTETITEGCSCNGSRKSYNTFVVYLDGTKYNIKGTKCAVKQPVTQ